ncbi:GNAT family [Colletotrichum truncatum]|uniref:GNAT family n=1 Tax=Colletotrichum truncatum TaxID=5467 RepID=A0ACC3Z831_COLTU|nr:GNAT family [Colletotrichum truncatum]KAF6783686.1 GNAT family [Colletotrichum truncatum]
MTTPVVEKAQLHDAAALTEVFLKGFNDEYFQTLFPQNEFGREYMIRAYEGFMLSKEHKSQEGQVFVVKNEKGEVVAGALVWIIRPEDNGTWSWRKRWPAANEGQKDELLDQFFTDMATQHESIMGKDAHIYFEVIMTDPAYQRRGYALALLQRAAQIADDLGYRSYLDSDPDVTPLYQRAGYAVADGANQTSFMVPMVRPAKSQVSAGV